MQVLCNGRLLTFALGLVWVCRSPTRAIFCVMVMRMLSVLKQNAIYSVEAIVAHVYKHNDSHSCVLEHRQQSSPDPHRSCSVKTSTAHVYLRNKSNSCAQENRQQTYLSQNTIYSLEATQLICTSTTTLTAMNMHS